MKPSHAIFRISVPITLAFVAPAIQQRCQAQWVNPKTFSQNFKTQNPGFFGGSSFNQSSNSGFGFQTTRPNFSGFNNQSNNSIWRQPNHNNGFNLMQSSGGQNNRRPNNGSTFMESGGTAIESVRPRPKRVDLKDWADQFKKDNPGLGIGQTTRVPKKINTDRDKYKDIDFQSKVVVNTGNSSNSSNSGSSSSGSGPEIFKVIQDGAQAIDKIIGGSSGGTSGGGYPDTWIPDTVRPDPRPIDTSRIPDGPIYTEDPPHSPRPIDSNQVGNSRPDPQSKGGRPISSNKKESTSKGTRPVTSTKKTSTKQSGDRLSSVKRRPNPKRPSGNRLAGVQSRNGGSGDRLSRIKAAKQDRLASARGKSFGLAGNDDDSKGSFGLAGDEVDDDYFKDTDYSGFDPLSEEEEQTLDELDKMAEEALANSNPTDNASSQDKEKEDPFPDNEDEDPWPEDDTTPDPSNNNSAGGGNNAGGSPGGNGGSKGNKKGAKNGGGKEKKKKNKPPVPKPKSNKEKLDEVLDDIRDKYGIGDKDDDQPGQPPNNPKDGPYGPFNPPGGFGTPGFGESDFGTGMPPNPNDKPWDFPVNPDPGKDADGFTDWNSSKTPDQDTEWKGWSPHVPSDTPFLPDTFTFGAEDNPSVDEFGTPNDEPAGEYTGGVGWTVGEGAKRRDDSRKRQVRTGTSNDSSGDRTHRSSDRFSGVQIKRNGEREDEAEEEEEDSGLFEDVSDTYEDVKDTIEKVERLPGEVVQAGAEGFAKGMHDGLTAFGEGYIKAVSGMAEGVEALNKGGKALDSFFNGEDPQKPTSSTSHKTDSANGSPQRPKKTQEVAKKNKLDSRNETKEPFPLYLESSVSEGGLRAGSGPGTE